MKSNPLKVMIVGAGTGGLCLAQGLKSEGIPVEIFEREHSPSDRQAGYRLSISPTGNRALKECLPDSVFRKLVNSSARPSRGVSFLDEGLQPLLMLDLPDADPRSVDYERPISRIALRHVLLQGLDEIVHFDKKFVAYDDAPDGRVTARFEDGSTATGDLLIGADGAGSRVRTQLLPHAQRAETGIMAVSGRVGLNDHIRELTPAAIFRGPTLMLGPKGCFLFANAVEYEDPHNSTHQDRLASSSYGLSPSDREEYVMWGFSARREKFGSCANPGACDPDTLKTVVLALMKDWHPALRCIVQNTTDISTFLVKSSVPVPAWKTRNVTLLGDALHNMTPFRGMGANVALRDAAALRRALVEVVHGESPLLDSLAEYERQMIEYGFRAVRMSLGNMRRVHSEGIARELNKMIFRLIDFVPALKKRFHSAR
ncbi:MAG: FAD-dependent monooxygenase [Verrucomicrobia bacterium]|nr:FAD-dependent monooxygenase [Verrucomicrobiota bacterium]